jgi:hypothetical protein
MKRRIIFVALMVLAALLPMIGVSLEEDAHSVGCLPSLTVQSPASVCIACHKDGESRWQADQYRPCTPYCKGCHKAAQMDRHHHVEVVLPRMPDAMLKLAAENKLACFTCHDLSRPRYDSVRWKAASLYTRLFRSEARYKTYFLVARNDEGQLCLSCH